MSTAKGPVVCLSILATVLLLVTVSSGGIPRKINYQFRLVESLTGEPLTGPQNVTFRIYDQASGGSVLWTESQVVAADAAGTVSTLLGATVPLEIGFNSPAWLEIEVNTEVLLPRREIVPVPNAFHAMDADSLGGHSAGAYLRATQTGTVTADMIADGEIINADISESAAIDPAKIAGTAWTSTNDGSGSGLDADMVDGLNADAFSDTGHAHDELYRRKEELQTPGTINFSMNPVDWTKLKNVPGGFADGTDDVGGAGDGHSLDAADGSWIDVVYVSNDGNVGIGTTDPTDGKVVVLTASTTGVHSATNSGTGILGWSASGTGVMGISSTGRAADFVGDVYISDQLGIGTDTPFTNLDVLGEAYVSSRLGVGTDNPAVSLDVEGAVSADSVYMIRDQRVMTAAARNKAVALGIGASATRLSYGCTMVGHEAGYNNIFSDNTFVGSRAGFNNDSGNDNTFVGARAGEACGSGEDCTLIGAYAGNLAKGPGNTFVGAHAGELTDISHRNTFIGAETAASHSSGSWNTFVGSFAGYDNVNGDRNVFVGFNAGAEEMGSDKLYIANDSDTSSTLIYGDFSSGRIGLGTIDPQRKLHIRGDNPRILIDAYASNPEVNFRNAGDTDSQTWAIYKRSDTDDLRFYQDFDRVTFESGTGNVGIGTPDPTSRLHVVGDIYCTGKLTSIGGNDPPYVLYDRETRQAIVDRVAREVPEDKLDGAVLFWNGDDSRFEVYLPAAGEFRDLMGNLLAEISLPGKDD